MNAELIKKLDKVRVVQDRVTFKQWLARVNRKYPGHVMSVTDSTASCVWDGKQVATWNDETKKFWIRS